ncbi:MAG: DNA mismatch repair protein MutS [Bdellovibrionota bacterium]
MTPLLKQYWEIKSLHPDKVLFFRMGDFYELFFDDAVKAAPLLGITLTQRNKKSQEETPMCGVPHHSVSGHINNLLKLGHKVALCDQIEDPKLAKGIVKRAVTRVLTPGMVYDLETLDGERPNYLMAYDEDSISYMDTSTGESFFFRRENSSDLKRWMNLLPVAEIIADPEQHDDLAKSIQDGQVISLHQLKSENGLKSWEDRLNVARPSQQRILSYVHELSQEQILPIVKPFEEREWAQTLSLSPTVIRQLEFFETYLGETEGSLFNSINCTKTSAGARKLRQWMLFPLTSEKQIVDRQDKIEGWRKDLPRLRKLREVLSGLGDLERRLAKISLPTSHARDILALGQALEIGINALEISGQKINLSDLQRLAARIAMTVVDEPPISIKAGGIIKPGVNNILDEYMGLTTDSQSMLQAMENRERARTGITSLKIRFNQVFGYYLEVTNSHKEKVPADYRRKQTLTNAERYTTDELDELEKKVITAQSKRNDLEFQIFEDLRQEVLKHSTQILTFAQNLAVMDVTSGLAWLSIERNYVRPVFNREQSINIKGSRHPVVEKSTSVRFVANNIFLAPHQCMLLTGPNMAGKSTLMRQVALTVILAQIGSYVPATTANIPLFNKIFTRIGASDQLSQGLSTFMVEMCESAEILSQATSKSLVILDEIGRGTSTYDGMSLAQAILEHIVNKIKCLTLFATHYHELTSLSEAHSAVINAHMAVSERNGQVQFLHTLTSGPALRSYGIHVAKLANVPKTVTDRAQTLLEKFEDSSSSSQLSLFAPREIADSLSSDEKNFLEEFKKLNVDELSPLQALLKLNELKNKL